MHRSLPGRSQRLAAAVVASGGRCVWCGQEFGRLVLPTVDHLVPKVKGGPSWPENEVPACRRCNGQRGHLTPVDWAQECSRRGWPVDTAFLLGRLEALQEVIAVVGGQRRARPYLSAQLRRFARL